MNDFQALAWVVLAGLGPSGATLQAKPAADAEQTLRGASLYRTYCASCHGRTGRGDGPMADQLRFAPADLTQLAGKNRGQFPSEAVARKIDGRSPLKGHGGTDMPVWGDALKNVEEGYGEKAVQEKIGQLVQFLATIQAEDGR